MVCVQAFLDLVVILFGELRMLSRHGTLAIQERDAMLRFGQLFLDLCFIGIQHSRARRLHALAQLRQVTLPGEGFSFSRLFDAFETFGRLTSLFLCRF